MTGGTAVILGSVGDNFGAGFTGGMAYVYDPDAVFERRLNPESLIWQRVAHPHWEDVLRKLVESHAAETASRYAARLLHDWDRTLPLMWHVVPKDYVKYLPVPMTPAHEEAMRA